MGATNGKKKAYNIDHDQKQHRVKNGRPNNKASANLQQSDNIQGKVPPTSSHIPPPDYVEGDDSDLIKPKQLLNPVKASKSHQELHRELMSSCRRGGAGMQTKAELHRVLETRKRDQLIKQKKQEDDAHKKVTPLEAELIKRYQRLDELERQQQKEKEDSLKAPEFIKVKENLRRTSVAMRDEKEV
ncbi:protein FAM107B-like isoform X2 [Antennarius striatus]|uniref:protein FAM107B-like isoform X2 n=1 Tax=Antennarius striatus TaxID=241820 RepID=UPI0035AF12C7